MKITLDHNALKALIEQGGEEFTLDIQKGVIAAVISKTVKMKSAGDVLECVQEVISKIASEEIFMVQKNHYESGKVMAPKVRKALDSVCDARVKSVLKKKLEPMIQEQIGVLVEEKMKSKMDMIEKMVALKFNTKLSGYIEDQIQNRLDLL